MLRKRTGFLVKWVTLLRRRAVFQAEFPDVERTALFAQVEHTLSRPATRRGCGPRPRTSSTAGGLPAFLRRRARCRASRSFFRACARDFRIPSGLRKRCVCQRGRSGPRGRGWSGFARGRGPARRKLGTSSGISRAGWELDVEPVVLPVRAEHHALAVRRECRSGSSFGRVGCQPYVGAPPAAGIRNTSKFP